MKLLNLGCGARHHPDWVNVDFSSHSPGVLAHDLKEPLPFPDGTFDAVYHSHVLEHLPRAAVPGFLAECRRVLRPDGVIRVAVPDLERIARTYLELLEGAVAGNQAAMARYEWIVLELFDQMVRNAPGGEMLAYWEKNPMPAEEFVFERVGSEARNCVAALRSAEPRPRSAPVTDPLRVGQFRLSGEVHQWMYDRYSLGVLLGQTGFREIAVRDAHESAIPGFTGYLLDVEPDGAVRKPDSLFMEALK
ncbi:class I SAM-dependent methyltransferase [Fundidesulfovibrio terrae]|uniref:class I SAM-dependent methyltransferase n=1 Tax=Fundidesulfovibrio terrae TaxID=2922866 RepID=UPI001FAFC0F8|nr:methyltransferase domain-containing protein [Fundidesulfovibrio terrae]